MKAFLFSKCVGARHLSQHTIDDYSRTLIRFAKFLEEDYAVTDITTQHVESFFASHKNLSNKSLLNYYRGLSSLWTWLGGGDRQDQRGPEDQATQSPAQGSRATDRGRSEGHHVSAQPLAHLRA